MNAWFELLLNSDRFRGGGPEAVLFSLLLAFIIGQIVGWVYQRTHRGLSYSQSFTVSLVVLPVLVALMMLLMSGSLTIAFGLLAVFAVVRFRNVLKDTRDTIFILWAIVQGMAIGTGQVSSAVIGVLMISCILFYLAWTEYGARKSYDTIINLLCDHDQDLPRLRDSVGTLLNRHCLNIELASSQQDGAELTSLSYRLTLRDPQRRSELESELRSLSWIKKISIFAHEDESEV